jgi:phosphoglycerate dehydrogenase-like enzyme
MHQLILRRLAHLRAHLRPPLLLRGMASAASGPLVPPLYVAVVSPEDSPCLATLPGDVDATFLVHNTMAAFEAHPNFRDVSAIVYVAAGGNVALVPRIFDALRPNINWVHSFFAGVDALAPFIASHLQPQQHASAASATSSAALATSSTSSVAVPLTNGRGAFSSSLAEHVMASALHFNKKITRCQQNVRDRKWDKFIMPTLAGKTMGFVGFGHIGQTSARVAKAFGMNIVCLRRNKHKGRGGRGGTDGGGLADVVYGPEDKFKLLAESDFVVSVLPGTPETLDFFGAAEFDAMKADATFISVGRGLVVDEDALAQALNAGSIGAAALDVFKTEPLPETSPLWGCGERLLMTAHNADYTEDYFALGWDVWQQNWVSLREEGVPATPVDIAAGY